MNMNLNQNIKYKTYYDNNPILVLEKRHSQWIYYLGWCSFFNSLIGFSNGYHDTAFMTLSGFLSCINYWRNPTYGFRRNLDMIVTSIVVSYNLMSVFYCQKAYLYYIIGLSSVGLYFIGKIIYNKKKISVSTFIHCMAHLGAITCNYLLFTDNICIKEY